MNILIKGLTVPLILIVSCNVYNSSLLEQHASAGSSGASLGSGGTGGTMAMSGGNTTGNAGGTASPGGTEGGETNLVGNAGSGEYPIVSGWLHVDGNQILDEQGTPFRGRGANIFDTRQCGGCAWEDPATVLEGVLHRIDVLTDEWGADFIGLNLKSWSAEEAAAEPALAYWQDVVQDASYLNEILTIAEHVGTKPGVYLLISLEHPSLDPQGLPTEATLPVWKTLSAALKDIPHVMYAVAPPMAYAANTAEGWGVMNDVADAIRSEEHTDKRHIIAAMGLQRRGNALEYFLSNPLTAGGGKDIVYAVGVSAHEDGFDEMFLSPAKYLPVIITSFVPSEDPNAVYMTFSDCGTLMEQAEEAEIPYLAYSFSTACYGRMFNLVNGTTDCVAKPPLADLNGWGRLVKERLSSHLSQQSR